MAIKLDKHFAMCYIEWDDHHSMSNEWHCNSEIEKETSDCVIRTLGFLVGETDKHYIVSGHIGSDFMGGPTFILKTDANIWLLEVEEDKNEQQHAVQDI